MQKFFVKKEQINEKNIIILGEDVKHIKTVLRMKKGEKIKVCSRESFTNYICKIENIKEDSIETIVEQEIEERESNVYIHIFQGLPKADKMELVLQKGTELGASEFTPVRMKRCVVKLDEKDELKKINRWQKIIEVAAKQSKRNMIPKINSCINIEEICKICKEYDIIIVAYEDEEENKLKDELRKLHKKGENIKIGFIIGPEGGIDSKEIDILKNSGAKIVTLGNRILRTETVALVACSVIMYELEEI